MTDSLGFTPLVKVLARLEGVKSIGTKRHSAVCLAGAPHAVDSPLSIEADEDGTVRLHCGAGCQEQSVLDALGLEPRDLLATRPTTQVSPLTVEALAADRGLPPDFLTQLGVKQHEGTVLITYRTENGKPAHRHQIRRALIAKDGTKWYGTADDGKPVPYGLWRLKQAKDDEYLVIVSGESDCWTLWYHHFPALGLPSSGRSMTQKIQPQHVEGFSRLVIVKEASERRKGVCRRRARSTQEDQVRR